MTRLAVTASALFVCLARPCFAVGQNAPGPTAREPVWRIYHSLVYVEPLGGLLLTGGHSAHGWEADVRDMWIWHAEEARWARVGTYEASPKPSEEPGGEEAQAPAYDEQSNRLIVLNSIGETWALDVQHLDWRKLNPKETPTTRCGQGMAYDSESDRVILFGGFGCKTPNDPALSETWSFDFEAGQWTEMHPLHSPSPRMYFGMTYDRTLDRVVLWGGRRLDPITDHTVWLYDFNRDMWEALEIQGGPEDVLAYPGMAYRPDAADLLLFGGAALHGPFEGQVTGETWRLDLRSHSWERLSPERSPPAVAVHAMGYDPVARTAVVFGGEVDRMYSDMSFDGTWLYDSRSRAWKQAHSR